MNFFKKTFILSFITSVIFTAQLFAAPTATSNKNLVDKIVAVVNQDIILYSEYEIFRKGMEEEIKKSGSANDKEELNNSEGFRKKVLEQMIEDHLFEQEVKSLGLEATDSQIENVVAEIMKSNGLQTRKDLDRALRGEGLTYEEFTSEYRKRIGRSNLVNQTIRPKVKISDDEINTEYKKRTQSAVQEQEYLMSMILISKNNITLKEMEKLRKSIQSLSDFANVANQRTEGPGKGQGGTMGWIDPSDLQPLLSEATKKMKKGTISPILPTDSGYYILACGGLKSKTSDQETKIKNQIQEELMNTLITKNLNQYILDLKRKAHIEKFI